MFTKILLLEVDNSRDRAIDFTHHLRELEPFLPAEAWYALTSRIDRLEGLFESPYRRLVGERNVWCQLGPAIFSITNMRRSQGHSGQQVEIMLGDDVNKHVCYRDEVENSAGMILGKPPGFVRGREEAFEIPCTYSAPWGPDGQTDYTLRSTRLVTKTFSFLGHRFAGNLVGGYMRGSRPDELSDRGSFVEIESPKYIITEHPFVRDERISWMQLKDLLLRFYKETYHR